MKVAREANSILRMESRAWLDFSVDPSGEFQRQGSSDRVLIPLSIEFKNYGGSPAISVYSDVRIVRQNPFDDEIEIANIVTSYEGHGERKSMGVVYPGESLVLNQGYMISESNRMTASQSADSGIYALVIVCFYRSATLKKTFHTAKCFHIEIGDKQNHGWSYTLLPFHSHNITI